ncbi:MAG: metallophosphoesterase [Chitinispirillaceae bacterium]|nr:metallophosphoesterase [Chitinispirillaceae bacterium]
MAPSNGARPLVKSLVPRFTASTHTSNVFTLPSVEVSVIEMEDVLFHLDSAVMMPETPAGKSSTQGMGDNSEDDEIQSKQNKMAGIAALATVYKMLQFDSHYRLIITAHADTSASYNYNFKLTAERGDNVTFLLRGPAYKDMWAENCAVRHRIEDYQQVLTFAANRTGNILWNPVKVDDSWGPDTENAVEAFLNDRVPLEADALLAKIKADAKKKWPKEAWLPVYDLYEDALADLLGIQGTQKQTELAKMRTMLETRWIDSSKPAVACGEMWPIDSAEEQNYRSQLNRRVEIVLFKDTDGLDISALMQCTVKTGFPSSEGGDSSNQDPDLYRLLCPIWWYRWGMTPVYIPPEILKMYTWHLRFVYHDRIREANASVPEGLAIHVYEIRNGQTAELQSTVAVSDGVYRVNIMPMDAANAPDELFFTFEATDHWVRTVTTNTGPTSSIEIKTAAEIAQLDYATRQGYHRLPKTFTSRNAQTWYDKNADYTGEFADGEPYEEVVRNRLQLKPFGPNSTEAEKPLTFTVDSNNNDDTAAALLFPSFGCPAIVQRSNGSAVLYCYVYGEPVGAKPAKVITAEKVNMHIKLLRWDAQTSNGGSAVLAAKKALITKKALPFEFDEPLFTSDEEANEHITVERFDLSATTGFHRHQQGFYCGDTVYFTLSDLGVQRFGEELDGVSFAELYQVKIELPERITDGFYNLFWVNMGQEPEDLFLQRKLGRLDSVTTGEAMQTELLSPALVRHLTEFNVLHTIPVDVEARTYTLTNINSDSPVSSYHPVLITGKEFPGVACLGDLHVASRISLLAQSRARVIESTDPEMDPIGTMVSDPFLATCDLLAQAGADDQIDIVLLTGDLIDYIKSYLPASQQPLRQDDFLATTFTTQPQIWNTMGFRSKTQAQNHYHDGVDFISIYSLLVQFSQRYRKPFYVVAGNHDPYYWPWGTSPRVGWENIWSGGGDGSTDLRMANENVPADMNLTFYEAILAYGETYGVILEAGGIAGGDSNFKPAKFELFFTLFTPFMNFALQLPRWSLTGLYWGNEEDLIDPQSIPNDIPIIGPIWDGDSQGIGHLPRSDEAITDSQLALLRLAISRPDVCNLLMTHFTFVSYKEPRRMENDQGQRGSVGDVEFNGVWGTNWEAGEFDMGTFETNRDPVYGHMLLNSEPGIDYIFTGHMHRRGLYDITEIDTFGDDSVKTRFWDITQQDFNQTHTNSARIFVPDSGGNIPRYNLRGEFSGWGSDVPSMIKFVLGGNGTPVTVDHVQSIQPKARPRIAVALDYLYNVEGDDFITLFESLRMDEDALFDASQLDFDLRFRHESDEFDYRCLRIEEVRLYTYIGDLFHCAAGIPLSGAGTDIRIRFTFPSTVPPRTFKQQALSYNRRTFISFKFSPPIDAVGQRALGHYNFDSRYNYEVNLFHEWLLNRHFFRIGRINQSTALDEALRRRSPGNQLPDWGFRRQLYDV